jgi:trehalose 6-phosphate phosphatase
VLDADATISLLAARPQDTAVLVDFDGSLSPIVDRPEDAVALPAAVAVVTELVEVMGRVAVVSGRPVEFLAGHLPVRGLALVGQYGVESLINGTRVLDPRVVPYRAAMEEVAELAEARLPGVLVERKAGVSVTLHWRTTPEREEAARAVASDLADRFGLEAPQRGRMAVELRPPVAVDKGTAVDGLLPGYRVGAFAGDDLGDVPAFLALDRAVVDSRLDAAVKIGVTSPEAPPELGDVVDTIVDGPLGLVALLEALVARARV